MTLFLMCLLWAELCPLRRHIEALISSECEVRGVGTLQKKLAQRRLHESKLLIQYDWCPYKKEDSQAQTQRRQPCKDREEI